MTGDHRRPLDGRNPRPVAPNAVWRAFHDSLASAFGDIAGDLSSQTDALSECYVEPEIAQGVPSWIPPEFDAPVSFDGSQADRLLSLIRHRKRCVVIPGRIGTGKTTFIHHFLRAVLDRSPDVIPFYVDCRGWPPSDDAVEDDVDHRVDEYISHRFGYLAKSAYWDELFADDFGKIADAQEELRSFDPAEADRVKLRYVHDWLLNQHDFNRRRLRYLSDHGSHVCLILDNVDHLQPDRQEAALLLAFHKLSWISGTIVITIRPETFPVMERHTPMGAGTCDLIYLSPPSISQVLTRRLAFARKIIGASPRAEFDVDGIRVSVADADQFLDRSINAILTGQAADAIRRLCNEDIRHSLLCVQVILSSWLLDPRRFVAAFVRDDERQWKDRIPYSVFIRSLLLNGHDLYDPTRSFVVNLWNNGEKRGLSNCLVRYRCLEVVARNQHGTSRASLIGAMREFGYDTTGVEQAVRVLSTAGLTEALRGGSGERRERIVATTSGILYYDSLCHDLWYLQTVWGDSYFPSDLYEDVALDDQPFEERVAGVFRLLELVNRAQRDERKRAVTDRGMEPTAYTATASNIARRLAEEVQRQLTSLQGTFPDMVHPRVLKRTAAAVKSAPPNLEEGI